MKVFVTSIGGQLGHDVMNELAEGIGSDIKPEYSGIQDGSPVTTMPYTGLDITDKDAVMAAIKEIRPGIKSTALHGQT